MEKQYLQPQTYVKMIQELTATIGNLHAEIALQKAQYGELIEFATGLQKELDELKSAPVEAAPMEARQGE